MCSTRLNPLIARWAQHGEAAAAQGIAEGSSPAADITEEVWAQFLQATYAAADSTIGTDETAAAPQSTPSHRKPAHRPVHRKGDSALRLWKRERRQLWRTRQGPLQVSEQQQVQARIKVLDCRIKNHVRKAIHERKQRQMNKIVSLAPGQWLQHWRLLRKVGGVPGHATAGVPATAIGSDGQEHSEPDEIRAVWLHFWSHLAQEPSPDDPRFDEAKHQELSAEQQRQQGTVFGPLSEAESACQFRVE